MKVAPLNITAAALMTQFLVVIIIFVAAVLRAAFPPPGRRYRAPMAWTILVFSISTLGLLVFSNEFVPVWQPLFGDVSFSGVSFSTAMLLLFTLDALWVAIMVWSSGGSRISPYSPLLFALPALAIFLRQPPVRLVFYLALVSLFFSLGMARSANEEWDSERAPLSATAAAYWFVAIASLMLTTFIGYVTRPR